MTDEDAAGERDAADSPRTSAAGIDNRDTCASRSPTRRFRPLMDTSATISSTGIASNSNASKTRPSIPDIPVVHATLTGMGDIAHATTKKPRTRRGFQYRDAASAYFAATTLTISRHLLL